MKYKNLLDCNPKIEKQGNTKPTLRCKVNLGRYACYRPMNHAHWYYSSIYQDLQKSCKFGNLLQA
jgi:hypothetical protein